jgi:hypothetical protein
LPLLAPQVSVSPLLNLLLDLLIFASSSVST